MLSKRNKFGSALIVLIAIAVVFVAPLVDLEPTALRAARSAQLIAFAMVAAATMLALIIYETRGPESCQSSAGDALLPEDVLDLDCARLC